MKYLLLTFGEYFKLNHDISEAEGYNLNSVNVTERQFGMNPKAAKVNIQQNGNYDLAFVLPVDKNIESKYSDLLNGIELLESFELAEDEITEIIAEGLTKVQQIWLLEHYAKAGNLNGVTVIWLEDEPITEDITEVIEILNNHDITVILPDNGE